jgi:V8-like Glu-specific endopeptidase
MTMGAFVACMGMIPILESAEAQSDTPIDDKEIYGADDRLDIFEVTDPVVGALADSVAGLFYSDRAPDRGDGGVDFFFDPRDSDDYWLCGDERFSDQPTAPFYTAFMVGPDLIATAGHCVSSEVLDDLRIVFGFEMIDANSPVTSIGPERVYRIADVVVARDDLFSDYAILRVDRPIVSPGAVPLPLQTDSEIVSGTRVGIIGHPQGLPLKVAFGVETTARDSAFYNSKFIANFDASGGNSGSPVFNQKTGEVEGIYVSSLAHDFAEEDDCLRLTTLNNEDGAQFVQRSSSFTPYVSRGCAASRASHRAFGVYGDVFILALAIGLLMRSARTQQNRPEISS